MASCVRPERISLPMMISAAVTVRSLIASSHAAGADIAPGRDMPIANRSHRCYQLIVDNCRTWRGVRLQRDADRGGVARRPGWLSRRDGIGGAFAVEGDTFPHRELIKRQGGRWSGSRRRWLFAFDATGLPPPGLAAAPAVSPRTAPRPSRAGAASTITATASGCAAASCEVGARPLADYELLELLLFFSIYRRDTKPIAKAMIERVRRPGRRAGGRARALRRVPGRWPAADAGAELRQIRDDDLLLHPGAAEGGPRAVPARAEGGDQGPAGDRLAGRR